MTKLRLQHVSLPILQNGQDQVRAFYGRLLGFVEKPVPYTLADAGLVWFVAGDNEMEIHFLPDPISPNQQESRHICLEVDNLEDYRQRLKEAGYQTTDGSPIPNRPRFFCRDPFGNLVEFTSILGDYRKIS